MPTMEVDFEVWCTCGNGLCNQTKVKGNDIHVEPCDNCLENAKKESFDEGHDEGYQEGYKEGKEHYEELNNES